MFTCWLADGSAGVVSGYRIHRAAGRARLVLGGARPARRAAAARRRVGRAGARRPAARQGARPVGRAHVRRPDASSGRSPTRPTPSALDDPADALGRAYGVAERRRLRPRVVRHRRRAVARVAGDGYAAGRRRARAHRAGRRTAACSPRRRPGAGTAGRRRSAPLALPEAFAHTRAAGAVRVPRRHRRRLGPHPGRLAVTSSRCRPAPAR